MVKSEVFMLAFGVYTILLEWTRATQEAKKMWIEFSLSLPIDQKLASAHNFPIHVLSAHNFPIHVQQELSS